MMKCLTLLLAANPTPASSTTIGIPVWGVVVAISCVGALSAFLSIYLVIKTDWKLKGNLISFGSTFFGAILGGGTLGNVLEFHSGNMLFSDAAAIAIIAYSLCTIFLPSIFVFLLVLSVLLVLAKRCGPRCAGLAINHLVLGSDREQAVRQFWSRFRADEAWGEFAVGLAEARRELLPSATSLQIYTQAKMSSDSDAGGDGEGSGDDDSVVADSKKVLDEFLYDPLLKFNAEVGCSRWRFSVWRVCADRQFIERVWVAPDYPPRQPVPLWAPVQSKGDPLLAQNESGTKPASLAAEAMQLNKACWLNASDPASKKYPQGGFGREYVAFRCEPLVCDGDESPWGVLCIDLLHGTIPVGSRCVGILSGYIVNAIQHLGPVLKTRTFQEASKR